MEKHGGIFSSNASAFYCESMFLSDYELPIQTWIVYYRSLYKGNKNKVTGVEEENIYRYT
jgi:hypothetical protein